LIESKTIRKSVEKSKLNILSNIRRFYSKISPFHSIIRTRRMAGIKWSYCSQYCRTMALRASIETHNVMHRYRLHQNYETRIDPIFKSQFQKLLMIIVRVSFR